MAGKRFPKAIFVTRNEFCDGSGDWLAAATTELEAVENEDRVGKEVARYVLERVDRLEVKKTVEVVKAK